MLVSLVLVGSIALGLYFHARMTARWLRDLRAEKETLHTRLLEAQERLATLSKYEPISDAEAYISQVLIAAGAAADALKMSAANTLSEAREQSLLIVDAAQLRAQTIACEAHAAREKAVQLEQTARAMENMIAGYAAEYLIPPAHAFDELTAGANTSEAAIRLKDARDRVREIVRRGAAAASDNAIASRRQTASHFVLDAFNAKTDAILADVRQQPFGVLLQRLTDAFNLVNHNGQAFCQARVLPDYFAARTDELKWAVIAHALSQREQGDANVPSALLAAATLTVDCFRSDGLDTTGVRVSPVGTGREFEAKLGGAVRKRSAAE